MKITHFCVHEASLDFKSIQKEVMDIPQTFWLGSKLCRNKVTKNHIALHKFTFHCQQQVIIPLDLYVGIGFSAHTLCKYPIYIRLCIWIEWIKTICVSKFWQQATGIYNQLLRNLNVHLFLMLTTHSLWDLTKSWWHRTFGISHKICIHFCSVLFCCY